MESLFRKKINISVQKRNGRKMTTIITGIDDDIDLPRVLSHIKKKFSCNGSVKKDKNDEYYIQLSGDKKNEMYDFLIQHEIGDDDNIIFHGI